MCKIQILREFVNKRLIDVAEEICGIFERIFAEFEEESNRSRQEIDHQRKHLNLTILTLKQLFSWFGR